MDRSRLFLPILVCLALAGGACSFLPAAEKGRADSTLTAVPGTGTVRVVHGSQTMIIRSPSSLSAGDRVEVAGGDVARLRAGTGRIIELLGAKVEVLSSSSFRLLSGRMLIRSAAPTRVYFGDLYASAGRGVFRVDKQLATRVANYSGTPVTVNSPAESLKLPAYRQVVTVQGDLPTTALPLRFSRSDPWDRRLLSKAIDLDARVTNFAQGLEAQLAGRSGIDFFAKVAPGGSGVDFLQPYLGSRHSDLLISLMMSAEAKRLKGVPLLLRFERIFRLWNQGASWGLLAQEFEVAPDRLFDLLTMAVERGEIQVIGAGPGLVQPAARTRRAPAPRTPPVPAPRTSGAKEPGPAATAPSNPSVLPPPVSRAVPNQLKIIVDDLYGVVDPVADLPPVL